MFLSFSPVALLLGDLEQWKDLRTFNCKASLFKMGQFWLDEVKGRLDVLKGKMAIQGGVAAPGPLAHEQICKIGGCGCVMGVQAQGFIAMSV